MPMRPIRFPGDLLPMGDMLVETFQYPENPEWSIQTDEAEDIAQTVRGLKRMWPLIRILQVLSPPLRDLLRGFLWEEEDRLAAAVLVQRMGSTRNWGVGVVGVLPEFRRRGLARRLLERVLSYLRKRDADRVILSVIDRNVPAYSLYSSLGFTHYSSTAEYDQMLQRPEDVPTLPGGYSELRLRRSQWRTRFALDAQITPDDVRRFAPIEEGRYRRPLPARLLGPVMTFAEGKKEIDRIVRLTGNGVVIARYGYRLCRRKKGTCSLWIRLDPEHAQLAPYIVGTALHALAKANPGRRVQLFVPRWMTGVREAAERFGFRQRLEYHDLGLILSEAS